MTMGGRANGQAFADGERGPPSARAEIYLQIYNLFTISVDNLQGFEAKNPSTNLQEFLKINVDSTMNMGSYTRPASKYSQKICEYLNQIPTDKFFRFFNSTFWPFWADLDTFNHCRSFSYGLLGVYTVKPPRLGTGGIWLKYSSASPRSIWAKYHQCLAFGSTLDCQPN